MKKKKQEYFIKIIADKDNIIFDIQNISKKELLAKLCEIQALITNEMLDTKNKWVSND